MNAYFINKASNMRVMLSLLREWDSNPRHSAYETDELTTATISHLLKSVVRYFTATDGHHPSILPMRPVIPTSETFTHDNIYGRLVLSELVFCIHINFDSSTKFCGLSLNSQW